MPELKFLANMNISVVTVQTLRASGWQIVRVSEVMDPRSTDLEILRYARQHELVLITQDMDFSTLLALGGYSKPSLMNLRLEQATPAAVSRRLMEVIPAVAKDLQEGAAASINDISVRTRKLPIILG